MTIRQKNVLNTYEKKVCTHFSFYMSQVSNYGNLFELDLDYVAIRKKSDYSFFFREFQIGLRAESIITIRHGSLSLSLQFRT